VLLLHPQVPLMHAGPFALAAHSLLVMHWTQPFVAQWGAPPGQSALVTHWTQSPVWGLHTGGPPELQSAFVWHLGPHWPKVLPHTSPAGQSALEEQPHQFELQAVPWALPAQSAADVHPQVFVEVLQLDPARLAAQSAFAAHSTHRPVAVLQASPDVLPTQSEFDVQAGSHKEGRLPVIRQISPDGQSAFVVQLHVPMGGAGTNMPAGPPPPPVDVKHTLPPVEAAQSAFVTQPTHTPVAVSHAGPDVLPAQSALLVQAFEH
jgi:hypothetical protein